MALGWGEGDTNQSQWGHFGSDVTVKHSSSSVQQNVGYVNCLVPELKSSLVKETHK